MKKELTFIVVMLLSINLVKAYDFSAAATTGQTLYFNYNADSTGVIVTCPGSTSGYHQGYTGFAMPTGVLVIPDSVSHKGITYPVVAIGYKAFQYCEDITSVTLPSTVTSIEDCAFEYCHRLTSAILPATVSSIGTAAFCFCYNLASINFPDSLTYLGSWAFGSCTSLTSISLPSALQYIGQSAFNSCTAITSVLGLESVTVIDEGAFYRCLALERITLPNTLTKIGCDAFGFCRNLDSVVLGYNITSIDYLAFRDCTSLHSITIPNSITKINASTFVGCTSLTSVILGMNVDTIDREAFDSCPNLSEIISLAHTAPKLIYYADWPFHNTDRDIPVHIPRGQRTNYQTAWAYFRNFIEDTIPILSVASNIDTMGTAAVRVSPTDNSSLAVVEAVPTAKHIFTHWSNGETSNPYTLTVTQDTLLTAYFARVYDTIVIDGPLIMGDTMYVLIPDTIYIDPLRFRVDVESDNPTYGNVCGRGLFPMGTVVEIGAIPFSGYRFVQWYDGDTDNPRIVSVDADLSFLAMFEPADLSVTMVEPIDHTISAQNSQIVVSNATNRPIRIFDTLGRCLSTTQTAQQTCVFKLPTAGIYFVQVGSHPAQKVVVVR